MKISEAVRKLREAYGDESQQAFATRLEMSIASIANFERGARIPDSGSAEKLARAAIAKGRDDLQAVFDTVIRDELGGLVAPIHTEDEHRKFRSVQYILFDPRFQHLQQDLNKLLAPVEAHLRKIEKKLGESSKRLGAYLDEINKGQKRPK
jgi:transcriptional regulator with XRE-family HTH domain